MPVSKRAKIVHESKTAKKAHKEQTRKVFANVQAAAEQYDHLFVFSIDNMRNTYLKDVRAEFSDSRFVLSHHSTSSFKAHYSPRSTTAKVNNTDDFRLQSYVWQNKSHGPRSWHNP